MLGIMLLAAMPLVGMRCAGGGSRKGARVSSSQGGGDGLQDVGGRKSKKSRKDKKDKKSGGKEEKKKLTELDEIDLDDLTDL